MRPLTYNQDKHKLLNFINMSDNIFLNVFSLLAGAKKPFKTYLANVCIT